MKIIITYLIAFLTPLGSLNFGHYNSYFLANFLFFHVNLKAKKFDPVKKVSVFYLLRFLRNGVLTVKVDAVVSVKCADIYIYIMIGYWDTSYTRLDC